MTIRNTVVDGQTVFFVADDLGLPVSFGYPTEQQAIEVAELIETSEGNATIPDGVDVSASIKPSYTVIEICVDGVWAGSGKLRGDVDNGHQIVDCGAQFSDDQDASEKVYEAIEDAIDEGDDQITVDGKRITWTITVPV